MKGGGSGFGLSRFVLAVNYTISAKETKYKGIWFRSRLEARWAAFFDLVGIVYHYEPFDLPGWSPDFLVRVDYTNEGHGVINWLLEVKPVLAPEKALFSKMTDALAAGGTGDTYAPMLVGLAPWFSARFPMPYLAWGSADPNEAHSCALVHCLLPGDQFALKVAPFERPYWENLWGEAHNLSRFWKPKP